MGAVWSPVRKTRPGKNAADIALTFEAAMLARERQINELRIVSGDSDFTPLIEKVQASGIRVVVYGPRNSTAGLRDVCDSFVLLDDLAPVSAGMKTSPPCVEISERTKKLFKAAYDVALLNARDEWANLADLGNAIRKIESTFQPQDYGERTLG